MCILYAVMLFIYFLKRPFNFVNKTPPRYKSKSWKAGKKMSVWARLFSFKIGANGREKFGQRAWRDIKGDELFSTPRC